MNFNEWLNSIKCPNWAYSKCEVDTFGYTLSHSHFVWPYVRCVSVQCACVDIQNRLFIFSIQFDFGWMYSALICHFRFIVYTQPRTRPKTINICASKQWASAQMCWRFVANERRRERQQKEYKLKFTWFHWQWASRRISSIFHHVCL